VNAPGRTERRDSAVTDATRTAIRLVAGSTARPASADPDLGLDFGIPVLTGLLTGAIAAPVDTGVDYRHAVLTWVRGHRVADLHPGLFARGLTGFLVGLDHACVVEPALRRLIDPVRDRLVEWTRTAMPPARLGFRDYDLILGISGAVTGLATLPDRAPGHLRPGVRYLLRLCLTDRLAGLRIGDDGGHALSTWATGRINHGMAHGCTGVLAALLAARPVLDGAEQDQMTDAVAAIARHLREATYQDVRGVISWPHASIDGPSDSPPQRQGWCYGTPGVAWQLTEAGRALDDRGLVELGEAAMDSLCAAWDDEYYLRPRVPTDQLALCHGAAGVLAVARAFDRAGPEPASSSLADHLNALLHRRIADVDRLADADPTMLTGAAGVLATLLTGSAAAAWLRCFGLR
jgi:hypothetical protein